jgi:large subunit ribosomal protein L15
VNLRDLEARFDDGAEVTPVSLKERGLATRKDIRVKILGQGDLSKKLTVQAHAFSATAREKIEGAGGVCTILDD